MRRLCCVLAVLVVTLPFVSVVSVAAPPAPDPFDPDPDPNPPAPAPTTPAPTAAPTPAPTTPMPTNATANESGGSGGILEMLAQAVGSDTVETQGSSAITLFAYVIIAAVAYTPAPNNLKNGYFNPSNGMFDGRWDYRQETVMPIFWWLVLLFGVYYLFDAIVGGLSKRPDGLKKWFWGVVVGVATPTLVGLWLNFRRGLTLVMLDGLTLSTIETNLSAGVVILAVLFLLFTDAWALATLVIIVGATVTLIPAGYPWLSLLAFLTFALPWFFARLVAGALLKAWVVITVLTLPIALLVGYGFSLDVSAQITQTAIALEGEQYAAVLSNAVTSVLMFVAKFGALAGGVLLAHKLVGLIDVVTPGVDLTPHKESVQQAAYTAQNRAQTARQQAGRPVNRAREAHGGLRQRVSALRADGGTTQGRPASSGSGSGSTTGGAASGGHGWRDWLGTEQDRVSGGADASPPRRSQSVSVAADDPYLDTHSERAAQREREWLAGEQDRVTDDSDTTNQ